MRKSIKSAVQILQEIDSGIFFHETKIKVPFHEHLCCIRQFDKIIDVLYVGEYPSYLINLFKHSIYCKNIKIAQKYQLIIYQLLKSEGYDVSLIRKISK